MVDESAITTETDSVEATRALGSRLGKVLAVGDVIALIGPLGAGKTAFVQGVAEGAGVVDRRQVNSPTFVIINEYEGRSAPQLLRIFHIDAYRLRHGDDLLSLGLEEMTERGAVLIEWADRVGEALPEGVLEIRIEPIGEQTRRFLIAGRGVIERLVRALRG